MLSIPEALHRLRYRVETVYETLARGSRKCWSPGHDNQTGQVTYHREAFHISDYAEGLRALRAVLVEKHFGPRAGDSVVMELFMDGLPLSAVVLSDGKG